MARLSREIYKDLNCLPIGWETREDLINIIIHNSQIMDACNKIAAGVQSTGIDGYMRLFFMKNSWQLTSWGALALIKTYQSWTLLHDDNALISGRILINMSKIIKSPWIARGRHVYVWNESVHFEMQMFDGSIKNFVDFYIPK